MIEATEQLPGTPRRVLSMKDFSKPEPSGAVLKPQMQKTTWPYTTPSKSQDSIDKYFGRTQAPADVPKLIADDADTVIANKLFEKCTCDGRIECAHCKELRAPHQHTIIEDHMRMWTETFKSCATNDEVDKLINTLESLKLERAIKRRAEVESLMEQARNDVSSHSREWIVLTRAIDMLQRRAVQS